MNKKTLLWPIYLLLGFYGLIGSLLIGLNITPYGYLLAFPSFPLAVIGTAYLMNRFFAINHPIVGWVYRHTMPMLEKRVHTDPTEDISFFSRGGKAEKGAIVKYVPILLFLFIALFAIMAITQPAVYMTAIYIAIHFAVVEMGTYYGGKSVGPAVMQLLPWQPNIVLGALRWFGLGTVTFFLFAWMIAGYITWPVMLVGLVLGGANYATFWAFNEPEPIADGGRI